MSFKRFIIATLAVLSLAFLPFAHVAKAEDLMLDEHVAILSYGYNSFNAVGVNGINKDNSEELYSSTGNAVLSAEAIESLVTTEEYDSEYRDMHEKVLSAFKSVVAYQLVNSFDKNEYSSSKNGIKRIEEELRQANAEIELAFTYDEIVSLAQRFYNFINYTDLSKNTAELSSKEDNDIKLKITCESSIFATDDELSVEYFTDSTVIANTIFAKSKNEELSSNSNLGLARYISIKWLRDGALVTGEGVPDGEDGEDVPVTLSIDAVSLGLNVDDLSSIKIARYLGDEQLEILDGVSVSAGGQIEFTLYSFSKDLETENGLNFAIMLDGYVFSDYESLLNAGYSYLLDFYANGGVISEDNQEELYYLTSSAVRSAETLKTLVTETEYDKNYRNQHVDVFRVFKNVLLYKLSDSYNESDYSPSDNGIVLLHSKLYEARGKISTASSYTEVEDAYNEFLNFISSDEISKKTSELSTNSDQAIQVTAVSNSPIFGEGDKLTTKKFLDSIIIKNTKVALIDNENLLDPTNGVAYFFSIRWERDGVITRGDKNSPTKITFSVDTSNMGITIDDSSCLQIVRYLGGQKVEFITATLQDGKIIFSLDNFGNDIESNYDLDFAVVIKGHKLEAPSVVGKFVTENMVIVISVASTLVILYLLIKIIKINSRRSRNKKYKQFRREYKAFKKFKKKQKKEKKLLKKQKRLDQKQKRLEFRQRQFEKREKRKQKKLQRNKINLF